jgi:hypothetical protein
MSRPLCSPHTKIYKPHETQKSENTDCGANAKILIVLDDTNTVVYTDIKRGGLGLFDITNAQTPTTLGCLRTTGYEPTLVALCGDYVIAVLTSTEYQPGFTIYVILRRKH